MSWSKRGIKYCWLCISSHFLICYKSVLLLCVAVKPNLWQKKERKVNVNLKKQTKQNKKMPLHKSTRMCAPRKRFHRNREAAKQVETKLLHKPSWSQNSIKVGKRERRCSGQNESKRTARPMNASRHTNALLKTGEKWRQVIAWLIYRKIGGCVSAVRVISSLARGPQCTNTAGSRRRGTGDRSENSAEINIKSLR